MEIRELQDRLARLDIRLFEDRLMLTVGGPLLCLLFGYIPWDRPTPPIVVNHELERIKSLRKKVLDSQNEKLPLYERAQISLTPEEHNELLSLYHGVDVNMRFEGRPLFVTTVIRDNREDLFQTMLRRGADLNSSDWGSTPLLEALVCDMQLAVEEKNRREKAEPKSEQKRVPPAWFWTRLLLSNGADPNLRPKILGPNELPVASQLPPFLQEVALGKKTLLQTIVERREPELLVLLLDHGLRIEDRTLLDSAVAALGSAETSPPWTRLLPRFLGVDGVTVHSLLKSAMESQNAPLAAELLQRGVQPANREDAETLFFLLVGARNASLLPDTLALLIKSGLQVNAPLRNGETPLIAALRGSKVSVIEELFRLKVDPNRPATDGTRPLDVVAGDCSLDDVRMLLKRGAHPDIDAGLNTRLEERSKWNSDCSQVLQVLAGAAIRNSGLFRRLNEVFFSHSAQIRTPGRPTSVSSRSSSLQ